MHKKGGAGIKVVCNVVYRGRGGQQIGLSSLKSAPCGRFAHWMHKRESAEPSDDVGLLGDQMTTFVDDDEPVPLSVSVTVNPTVHYQSPL